MKTTPASLNLTDKMAKVEALLEERKASAESLQMLLFTQINETLKELLACIKQQRDMLKNQEESNENRLRRARREFWLNLLLGAILGAIVGAIAGAIVNEILKAPLARIQAEQLETQNDIRKVARQVAANQPVISSPEDNGTVELTSTIRGTTPFIGRKHYIVVLPVENGTEWIQNGPISVDANGSFRGEARFGEGNNGIGKQFLVRIIVTDSSLPPGLSPVPEGAVFSDAITVTRQN